MCYKIFIRRCRSLYLPAIAKDVADRYAAAASKLQRGNAALARGLHL
jgi:hypothetical protein